MEITFLQVNGLKNQTINVEVGDLVMPTSFHFGSNNVEYVPVLGIEKSQYDAWCLKIKLPGCEVKLFHPDNIKKFKSSKRKELI